MLIFTPPFDLFVFVFESLLSASSIKKERGKI